MARLSRGLTIGRLRWVLGLLFLALAVPTAVLVWQTQRQLKWEAFHHYRSLAEELAARIDSRLQAALAAEEARGYGDYRFLTVAGDPSVSSYVQRSPLAQWPVKSELPGLLGYFQVDADGRFSTPLLPEPGADLAALGLGAEELAERRRLRDELLEVLGENQLLARRALPAPRPEAAPESAAPSRRAPAGVASEAPAAYARGESDAGAASFAGAASAESEAAAAEPEPAGDAAFDRLAIAAERARGASQRKQLDDFKLDKRFAEQAPAPQARSKSAPLARSARKEQAAVPVAPLPQAAPGPVRIFESEIDPFDFSLLGSGHFVLYRKVWRDGRRTVQGAILDPRAFVAGAVAAEFRGTALARMSDLVVAHRGEVLELVTGDEGRGYSMRTAEPAGALLYQTRLAAPLGGLELVWTVNRLPLGPGGTVVAWTSLVLFAVLTLGLYALYRLGVRQLTLAGQQQDFISAVSHELKTPLTSIRMYGEMLREGWVGEDKRREYYDYIHDESERLSRLIANVLQLARLERSEPHLDLKVFTSGALMDLLRSRLEGQIQRAGFEASFTLAPGAEAVPLQVDADAFLQIVINLVDNALKFSARAECKAVEIGVRRQGAGELLWTVRDYGPGVPRDQMKKIFRLFYRPGSELTRETVGTGIGLALVRQLAGAMGGRVDVVNQEPGAEFRLALPAAAEAAH